MENFIDLGGLFHIESKANPILNLEVHYTLDTKEGMEMLLILLPTESQSRGS